MLGLQKIYKINPYIIIDIIGNLCYNILDLDMSPIG
jgi:hypothetical protein